MKVSLIDTALILILMAVFTALGNAFGATVHASGTSFLPVFIDSLIAMALMGGMSFVAYLIARLPGFSKLPVIFWVSIIAAVLCSPLFPYNKEIFAMTDKVSVAMISTVVLAYAGLSLGKDIHQFKAISWKIIPVALAVFTGTFVIAAFIAQFTLHWSNVI